MVILIDCQIIHVRCPGYTIQFLNYYYSQYIRKVLELVEINPDKIEWRLYDDCTSYYSERRKDKLPSFKGGSILRRPDWP
jgi:hypothetical protein